MSRIFLKEKPEENVIMQTDEFELIEESAYFHEGEMPEDQQTESQSAVADEEDQELSDEEMEKLFDEAEQEEEDNSRDDEDDSDDEPDNEPDKKA